MTILKSTLFHKLTPLLLSWMVCGTGMNAHANEDNKKAKSGNPTTPASPTTAASKALQQSNAVLAKGPHGLSITVADVLSEANKMPAQQRPEFMKNPALIQQVTNNLLVRRVLAHEAKTQKLDQDQVVKAAMAVANDRVLSDARLNQLDTRNEPSAADIEAYARSLYAANLGKYETAAQTRASHILIEKKDADARQQAQNVLDKLKAGGKFEDLAKEFSKDPGSAARGGDLGFFGAGRMVKPFEDAVNALAAPGDVSGLVESDFGFHIIRLDERKAKRTAPFEEIKESLVAESRAAILSGKRIQMVQGLVSQMQFDKSAIEQFSQESLAAMGVR